ncbi:hypothetical protein EW146_g5873 [Bondarzewia mesenterica]|uniref:Uncharacterized protein n=1 Tax=Bondarzewia mesenterica TaxID=1095465 RepID=A0A4V3XEP2_9AGAM|nr:hypothetical protein EW146_g5873 [Bondarzewia mesenterica]
MPPPAEYGGRLTGMDLCLYMDAFAEQFLKGRIRFRTEVLNVRRDSNEWKVQVKDLSSDAEEDLHFNKIVGSSIPFIPQEISASMGAFKGPIFHTYEFKNMMDQIISEVKPKTEPGSGVVVVVGGGKSAQDTAASLALKGRKVKVIFDTVNAFLAAPQPLPPFIRKGGSARTLTTFRRFLHSTTIGNWIVHTVWNLLEGSSFDAAHVPKDSLLRRNNPVFWGFMIDDFGAVSPTDWVSLVNEGKIELVALARVTGFGENGRSVLLSNGERIEADAIVLGTGYRSSWDKIFDEETLEELGLKTVAPSDAYHWDHKSLSNPPNSTTKDRQAMALYRGIIPSKIIDRHVFAVNGAIYTGNFGYVTEMASHWISSYFLRDPFLKVPSPEEALEETQARSVVGTAVPSRADVEWPQLVDTMLEDMQLPSARSGGYWFNWPFKVVDLKEIEHLSEERRQKRKAFAVAA